MAGDLCFFMYDDGIQLLPVKVYDTTVKTLTVTCNGKNETKEATTDMVTMFVFDMLDNIHSEITGTACDKNGNVLYTLENQDGWLKWLPVNG